MLRVDELSKHFGEMAALRDCSLEVPAGSITGIIGPNGSGKSTLFNCISGVLKPSSGKIFFDNKNVPPIEIEKLRPYQIARLGIGRTFQLNRVFKRMSVIDNLLVVDFDEKHAISLLELVGLQDFHDRMAGELSIGQQRLLEIARAFMLRPKLVLLDEPTAGVNPKLIDTLAKQIVQLQQTQSATFMIVEHNLKFILGLSDQIYVLSAGEVIASGTPDAIKRSEAVINAYLGHEHGSQHAQD